MARVLVVDDEQVIREFVSEALRQGGHDVEPVESAEHAMRLVARLAVDVAVIDLNLSGENGLALVAMLRQVLPQLACVLITGFPDFAVTIASVTRAGRFEFLAKPFTPAQIQNAVGRALARQTIARPPSQPESTVFEGMVGSSQAMRRVFDQITRFAPTGEPVLILGESGTGKELVARALHRRSGRRGPFVTVNCGAIGPEGLLESELFGHERGAFTGAHKRSAGWFESANGGTLFLDEIGEMPLSAQAKLLRALEAHEVTRLGGRTAIGIDARVIAATNRDLLSDTRTFRADLVYRLRALLIVLPPLRRRLEDLPLLVRHLLPTICEQMRVPVPGVTDGMIQELSHRQWLGNVRELEQVLKRAGALAQGNSIGIEHLDDDSCDATLAIADSLETSAGTLQQNVVRVVERVERRMIAAALAGSPSLNDAARALDIDVKTLYAKRQKYGI